MEGRASITAGGGRRPLARVVRPTVRLRLLPAGLVSVGLSGPVHLLVCVTAWRVRACYETRINR